MSFDDWVNYCFSDTKEIIYYVHQAFRNLQNVPLLARTEFFSEDVDQFPKILAQYKLDFEFKEIVAHNTASNDHDKTIAERISKMKENLSNKNYKKLLSANTQDFSLCDYATKVIEHRRDNLQAPEGLIPEHQKKKHFVQLALITQDTIRIIT